MTSSRSRCIQCSTSGSGSGSEAGSRSRTGENGGYRLGNREIRVSAGWCGLDRPLSGEHRPRGGIDLVV